MLHVRYLSKSSVFLTTFLVWLATLAVCRLRTGTNAASYHKQVSGGAKDRGQSKPDLHQRFFDCRQAKSFDRDGLKATNTAVRSVADNSQYKEAVELVTHESIFDSIVIERRLLLTLVWLSFNFSVAIRRCFRARSFAVTGVWEHDEYNNVPDATQGSNDRKLALSRGRCTFDVANVVPKRAARLMSTR